MKKFNIGILLTSVFLMGCSNGTQTAKEPTNSNSNLEMSIEKGEIVIPFSEYEEISKYEEQDVEEGIILNVKLTNKSSESLHVFADDFEFITDDGEFIANSDFDTSSSLFTTKQVRPKKEITAKLIFPLEQSKSYKLTYTSKSSEKDMDITIDVPVDKYDESKKEFDIPVDLNKKFINFVFLNEKEDSLEKDIANNLEDVKEKYLEGLRKSINDTLFYSAKLTDEDTNKIVDLFLKKQKEVSKIDYRLTGYLNDSARVTLKIEAIDMEAIAEAVVEYRTEYMEKNDFDTQKSAQYALDHINEIFDSAKVSTPKEPVNLLMKKKDGKWTIDTSDYSFDTLVNIMEGNIY